MSTRLLPVTEPSSHRPPAGGLPRRDLLPARDGWRRGAQPEEPTDVTLMH